MCPGLGEVSVVCTSGPGPAPVLCSWRPAVSTTQHFQESSPCLAGGAVLANTVLFSVSLAFPEWHQGHIAAHSVLRQEHQEAGP